MLSTARYTRRGFISAVALATALITPLMEADCDESAVIPSPLVVAPSEARLTWTLAATARSATSKSRESSAMLVVKASA